MTPPSIVAVLFASLVGISAPGGPPPAPVPRTGQAECYDGILTAPCAGTGQDGDTATGLAWPAPRFTAVDEQTAVDHLTGLTWTRDSDPAAGRRTWQQALDYVATLNRDKHLGHRDWRLPNVVELESLVNKQPDLAAWLAAQGFRGVREGSYWTSTTYASHPAYAWVVNTHSGIVAGSVKEEGNGVWPVSGGGVPSLAQSGQEACWDQTGAAVACAGTGQDGERRGGVAWPVPRFTRSGDGTATDRMTGLVWTEDGRTPGPEACRPGAPKAWHKALDHVNCLNANAFLGHDDWRLPNRNELASLVHWGRPNTSEWLNGQGFVGVQASSYWTSSTYPYNVWNAWSVNLHDGAVTSMAKKHGIHVWPVRGTQ